MRSDLSVGTGAGFEVDRASGCADERMIKRQRGHSGTEGPKKTEIIKACHVGQYPQDAGDSGEGGVVLQK